MGTLVQGLGTASGSAIASTALGALSTGLRAVGDVSSANGQADQYAFQAAQARTNAAITRDNAAAGVASGTATESAQKLTTGQTIAAQTAAQAGNGIDVNVGSPVQVRQSSVTIGALDAAILHFNAARAAYGLEADAAQFDTQAGLYDKAAANASKVGKAKAFSSILSGATALASRWDQYKQTGAISSSDKSTKGLY